ncbi:helix-turn-helix domain-containing protein [Streptomyces sp. TR06-5]|uniref:helix-turn-helix domain-containing protein n=1 Tax=Streptomyces sp. TR06-5 TaxID=3385976 RepID=UPI00399EF38B
METAIAQGRDTFGTVLRTHRRRAGMTQQQVADLATLSVRAVRDLESGRARRPRRATVQLLSDVLRLSGGTRTAFEAAADPLPAAEDGVDWLLPVPRTPLIGRDGEHRVLSELLTVERQRQVRVAGITGIGKTRLTLEVAHTLRHREGWSVLWCDTSRSFVDTSLVDAAECALSELVGEDALLVLDGAHGPAVDEAAARLLGRFPRLSIVTTEAAPSREDDAQVMPVGPLAVPSGECADGAMDCPSVRLFHSHLRRFRPHQALGGPASAAVISLCRLLDGIPGQLVDAAAWCLLHSPEELLRAMAEDTQRFALPPTAPAGGPDPLEGLLGAVGPRERDLLTHLARLPGAWTVDEAVMLSGGSTRGTVGLLHALLMRGLVRTADEEGAARFRVLNMLRPMLAAERSGGGRAAAAEAFCR